MTHDGLTTASGASQAALQALGEVIRQIDGGELAATSPERAYLAGALAALGQVTQS